MPMVYWDTAGTATVQLTIPRNPPEVVIKTLQGCFVKKEANVKHFIEKYIDPSADRNKYKRSDYLFYCCVSDFREVVTRAVIKYEKPSWVLGLPKQKTKTCSVKHPLIITFDGHFFLCCVFEDLGKESKFLAECSKEVRIDQDLGTRKTFFGLGIHENYLMFISFKTQQLQNHMYAVNDRRVFNKLLETGPLLLDDHKTIVGCYRKLPEGNQRIEINIFGNQDTAPGHQGEAVADSLLSEAPERDRLTDQALPGPSRGNQQSDTIPSEILARGPEAFQAYEKALESGKTKNRRLLVMVVGPARAGKTSLLKSLKGEMFDPKPDSTVGVHLHHTFCKPKENSWSSEDGDKGVTYTDCMVDVICENLQGENDSEEINDANFAEARRNSMEISGESRKSLPDSNNDENEDVVDDVEDGNKTDESKSKSYQANEEAKEMEKQKCTNEKSKAWVPKLIEEKLILKLKDRKSSNTKGDELYIKTLDFGGQAVYNVIHPIFLSSKAVFILVYNLKNNLHDTMKSDVEKDGSIRELVDPFEMTNLENLELWLSCISSYAYGHMEVEGLSLPPVFIVGTHADEYAGKLDAAKQIIRQTYKCLLPSRNPSGYHVKRDEIYTVDNSVSGHGEIRDESVRKLKTDIERLSKFLPHMNEDIPINWLLFEEELLNLVVKENKKYITIDEARKIASECKVNTSTESNEFTTLLNYLHDLKSIIYFEETRLVFIDTKWLVEVFTKVIEVTPTEKWGVFDESWNKLEEEGVLERALVEHVWKDLKDEQNTIDSLLLIMEKFSLICYWSAGVYLVPAMLCNSVKRGDIANRLKRQKMSTLVIRFNTPHVSLGTFQRLFVAILEKERKEWPNLQPKPKLRKNFCRIFNIGKDRNLDILVIQSSLRTISIAVCNKKKIDRHLVNEFCQHFRKVLDQIFEDMRLSFPWMQNMTIENGILCPVCERLPKECKSHGKKGCTRDSCFHFVNEEELIIDQPECSKSLTTEENQIEEEAYWNWFPRKVVSSPFDLSENQRRWLVIGISLNVALLPPLRKYLESNMVDHYTKLKASNRIDSQVYGGHLAVDGRCRSLNYRNINSNDAIKGKEDWDYQVLSTVHLAKLYLQPNMAKLTGFDSTCDLSAVLGILSSASVFTADVQDLSSQVRREIRNEWGHCNFESWDETKFADSFKLMHSLLKALKLSSEDEKTVADQLTGWKEKGVKICMAKTVPLELIEDIESKVSQLYQEFQHAQCQNEENVAQLSQDAKENEDNIRKVIESLDTVKDAVQSCKRKIDLVEEKVVNIEKEFGYFKSLLVTCISVLMVAMFLQVFIT